MRNIPLIYLAFSILLSSYSFAQKHDLTKEEAKAAERAALIWSESPGPREMHLIRRHNNPLFDQDRRIVTVKELKEAKSKDLLHHKSLKQDLENLLPKSELLFKKEFDPDTGWESFDIMRREVDKVIEKSAELGSIATEEHDSSIRLWATLMASAKEAVADHPELLKTLDVAIEHQKKMLIRYQNPLYLQLISEHKYIPEDEVLSSLLNQPLDSMVQMMKILGEQNADSITLIIENGLPMLLELNPQDSKKVKNYNEKVLLFKELSK